MRYVVAIVMVLALGGALVCASTLGLSSLASAGGVPFHGMGTANDPFQISTREDLEFLANAINAPVTVPDRFAHLRGATRHFKLMNNIDMGGMFSPWANPIGHGVAANRFSGIFDGGGHTISNLFFESGLAVTNYGLFGVTTNATIRNFNLEQATIMVQGLGTNIGPLVGHAMQGTHIENVSVTSGSTVMAPDSTGVGGLVGRSIGTSADAANSFRLCSSAATITGSSLVGGLVGIGTGSTFRECFAIGTVEGTAVNTIVGGFIGEIATTTRVGNAEVLRWAFYNNYAAGQVIASAVDGAPTTIAVGGFVGRVVGACRMTNVYASGNIMVNANAGTIRVGGLVGHALTTTEIVGSAAIMQQINQSGGTRHIGLLGAGAAPTSTTINRNNMANSQMMNVFADGVPMGQDIQAGTAFGMAINGNRLVPFSQFANQSTWTEVPTVVAGVQGFDDFDFNHVWMMDAGVNRGHPILRGFEKGTGTQTDPFLIENLADLLRFRQNVARGNTYAGRHFLLASNIHLTEENWTPIPNFLGQFDGGGNTISGLSITSRTVNDSGLFALLGAGGAIRNLTLASPFVQGTSGQNTGALVGRVLNNTIIENITITNAFVSSTNINVGGLVGYSHGTALATGVTIRNITVNGSIAAPGQTGGIIGRSEFTTMSILAFTGEVIREATGNVAGWHNFGGLVGFATGGENRIGNSFARANVRDAHPEFSVSTIAAAAGGLVGFNGVALRISNSYFAGGTIEAHTRSVTANAANSAYAGGLVGFSNTAAGILVSLTNNFVASATILARADTPSLESLFFVSASHFLNSPAARIPTMQNNMYASDVFTMMHNAHPTTGIPFNTGINVPRVNLSTSAFWSLGAFVGGLGWDFNNIWILGGAQTGTLPVHRVAFDTAGTRENPYLIRTAQDLRNMRDMVNQGNRFRDRFFRMENNIDLGGSAWAPIGSTDIITFAGNFDGGGYAISGLHINRTIDNKGLFGHTTGAVIENLTIDRPQVQRTIGHHTAALIGRATGGTILRNVHIEGGEISADPAANEIGSVIGRADAGTHLYRVSSTAHISEGRHGAGGLIGFAVGTAAAPIVITHSYFAGNITTQGAHYVGGLVGISRAVTIDQCYNAGSITVRARTAGGLIGHNYTVASLIRNSYNIGNLTITFNRVSGTSTTARNAMLNMGGIVANTWGVPVAIENVINMGELRQVNTWNVVSIGGIYGRADASTGNTMFGAVSAGLIHLESAVRSRAFFANGSAVANIPAATARSGLLWLDELNTHIVQAIPGTVAANLRVHDDADTEMKTRQELNNLQTYQEAGFSSDLWTIDPTGEINMGFPYLRNVEAVMPTTGAGSAPLNITTTEEFLQLRDAVNAGNSYIGLTVLVETDIHLTGIFQQIGQAGTPFSGTIDFQGHTIYGLNIQGTATNTGLFGYANRGAIIKNLNLYNPSIRGTANVGGIVGHVNGDVTIDNVHILGANALVHGTGGQVGGIVGRITNGFNVVIKWCSSNATVRGVADTGGIVGLAISTWGNQNLIADTFKTGNVESTGADVGGIVGEGRNTRIERCYSSGIVRSTLDQVGGLVGCPRVMRMDIVDSFSTSNVIGRNRIGGLVGATVVPMTVTNSYASGVVQSTVTAAAQVAGVLGELHTGAAITNVQHFGVAAINSAILAPRSTTARLGAFATGISAALTPRYDAQAEGSTIWEGINMGHSTIVNQILGHTRHSQGVAPVNVRYVMPQRSFAQYQDWETYQDKGWDSDVWEMRAGYNDGLPVLRNLPFLADERLGSEDNPILINNLEDLVNFRNAVNAGNTFFGQVIRLTNSIDVGGEEWIPIGSSVANHFGGIFDGNGHFIRNLTMTRSAAQTGFFGFTNAATVRDLGFVNVSIASTNTSATADVGVVVGQSMSSLTLNRVVVFGGTVTVAGQNIGGLVGRMLLSNNNITHSFVDNVTFSTTSLYLGGIVGLMQSGNISHCYFRGTINGTNTSTTAGYLGGIVGRITNNAALWAPSIQDVFVMGTIRDVGPISTAAGVIGRNERVDTPLQGGRTLIERALVNATIEASANTTTSSARRAVAMGIVGETTTPMIVRNSAVVGLRMHATATDARHALRAHPIGIGTAAAAAITDLPTGTVLTNSNRVQVFQNTLVGGTQALAWVTPALTGAQQPIDDATFFRGADAQVNYEDMGWNFVETWTINPVLNEGLPSLRDMPVVIDMLFVAIDTARAVDRSLFSIETLEILDNAIEYVEGRIASTPNITNDHVALWLITIDSAINGLRADSTELAAKVAHIMQYPNGVFHMQDQFLSFAHMNAMIENAQRLIEATLLAPLGHNRVTNPMIQNALAALELAYEGLLLDMSALRQLVQLSNQRNQIHYTAETWSPFAQARVEAMLVLGNAFSTMTQMQTAFDNLYNAMNDLRFDIESLVNYYNRAYVIYNNYPNNWYPEHAFFPHTWERLTIAFYAARDVLERLDDELPVTGSEVANATFNLQFALNTLEVDKSELVDLLSTMLPILTAGYTTGSANAFISARDAAQVEFMRGDSTPTTVRTAIDNLRDTYFALTADGERLAEIVEQANILHGLYTQWRETGELVNHPDFYDLYLESLEWDQEEWDEFAARIAHLYELLPLANEMLDQIDVPNTPPTRFPTAPEVATMAHELALRIDNIIVNQRMLELRIVEAEDIIRRFGIYLTEETRDALQDAINDAIAYLETLPRPTLAGLRLQRQLLQNAKDELRFNMQLLVDEIYRAQNQFVPYRDYFTPESFATFEQSLTDAIAQQTSDTLEYERLVGVLHDLRNAISMLLTDLSDLEALVLYAGTLNPAYFTDLTWANLENALGDANAILFGANPTIQTLRDAIQNLQDAIDSLLLNFNALTDIIDQIEQRLSRARVPRPNETPPRFFYRAAELGTIQSLLQDAHTMRTNSATTLPQMLSLINDLTMAQDALVVDYTHLRTFITTLGTLDATEYTYTSWEQLIEQIERTEYFLDSTFDPDIHGADHLVVHYQMLLDAMNALQVDTSALAALVNTANRVRKSFVTYTTWEPFYDALTDAIAILSYTGLLTVEDIRTAYTNLEAAIDALVADRTAMQTLVNELSVAPYYTVAANFLVDSWTAFNTARTAGTTAAANVNVNVFDLMEIYDELRVMHANLIPDLEPLSNLLGDAFEFDRARFTPDTAQALSDAIDFATAALEPPPSPIQDVFEAIRRLNEAMAGMVIDKSELEALIAQIEAMDYSLYTTASWNALLTQLNNARNFVETDSNNLGALETHIENLLDAIYNLVFNTGTLADLLERAGYHLPNARYYTLESFMALVDAVTFANDVLASGLPPTDDSWISATQTLLNALSGLVGIRGLRTVHEIAQTIDIVIPENEQLFINGTTQQVYDAVISTRQKIQDFQGLYPNFTANSWATFENELENALNGNAHELRDAFEGLVYVGHLIRIIDEINALDVDLPTTLVNLMAQNDGLLQSGTQEAVDAHVIALREALNNILAGTLTHIALNPLRRGYDVLEFVDDYFLVNFAAGDTLNVVLDQFINDGLRVFESTTRGGAEITNLDTTIATGMQIKLLNGEILQDRLVAVVTGDVRGLGNPNNADVGRLQAHVRGQLTEGAYFHASDVRGMGNPNNSDVGLLQSHVRGAVDIFEDLRLGEVA